MSFLGVLSWLTSLLTVLGAFTTLFFVSQICGFIYIHALHRSALVSRYLRNRRALPNLDSQMTVSFKAKANNISRCAPRGPTGEIERSWALVTGASDGLGKGFAQELCLRGFNVILHGRNSRKLERVREELQEEFPHIQTRSMVLDAMHFDVADMQREVQQIKPLPLTILVNNVGGVGPVLPQGDYIPFASYTPAQVDDMINLNVRFMCHLTRFLIPILAQNRPSLIVNIGSLATIGAPYLSLYAACKSFVTVFSHSLSMEFDPRGEDTGIEILEIQAGEVNTGHNRAKVEWNRPSSRIMAKSTLDKVGCGRDIVAGHWAHGVISYMVRSMGENMARTLLLRLYKAEVDKLKRDNSNADSSGISVLRGQTSS